MKNARREVFFSLQFNISHIRESCLREMLSIQLKVKPKRIWSFSSLLLWRRERLEHTYVLMRKKVRNMSNVQPQSKLLTGCYWYFLPNALATVFSCHPDPFSNVVLCTWLEVLLHHLVSSLPLCSSKTKPLCHLPTSNIVHFFRTGVERTYKESDAHSLWAW